MKSEISSTVSAKSGSSTASKMVKMVSVVSTIQTGHEDVIHDAQMDQFGLRLATCSSDASVRIYDVKTNDFMAELRGHEGPVWQIAWAPTVFGSLLASCSYDQRVIIWQESSGKWNKLYESKIHEGSVNSVCWGPAETGLILAAASSDGSISCFESNPAGGWDVSRVKSAHSQGCNAVTWASHLSHKPKGVRRRLATGGNDKYVKIWSETADGWKEESKLEFHADWVRDVAWASFGGLPVNVVASCSQDRTVAIWKEDCRKECGKWTHTVLPIFDDVLWHVSWSMIGNILAVSGGDNRITLWKEGLDGNWLEMSKAPEKQDVKENKSGGGSQNTSPPVLA